MVCTKITNTDAEALTAAVNDFIAGKTVVAASFFFSTLYVAFIITTE